MRSMDEDEGRFTGHRFCPFHDETKPSLAIYSNGRYYCWGCGAYGDVSDLGPDALRTTKQEKLFNTQRRADVRNLFQEISRVAGNTWFSLDQVNLELYQELNRELYSSGRYKYFIHRGLSAQTIRNNLLGWTGTRYTIPVFQFGKPYSLILRQSEIDSNSSFKYFSLPDTQAVLYNGRILSRVKSIIITEGPIDCLSLMQFRFPAVCSTAGASGFQREWTSKWLSDKDIYLLMDNDRGGQLGRELISEYFNGDCQHLYVPKDYNDVNEFLVSTNSTVFKQYFAQRI